MFNYPQICSRFLKDLPGRHKEVLSRRFALSVEASSQGGVKLETLESIGQNYGITRERVRQIERDALQKLQPKVKKEQRVFQYFKDYLKRQGELKREDLLLEELAGPNFQNQVYFLLALEPGFDRFGETEEYHSLWTISPAALTRAKKIVASLQKKLEKIGRPLRFEELNAPRSFLEISKKIKQNPEGLFGLPEWPEINPRGVKDKAFLVFKKEGRPLHFREVAGLIEKSLPQTVHNELIKDPRFVLVGRGLYALREWGYQEGQVKDVITRILSGASQPLTKEEIIEQVLKQRVVKPNTVLLNLGNKEYFLRNPEGFYTNNKKTHLA